MSQYIRDKKTGRVGLLTDPKAFNPQEHELVQNEQPKQQEKSSFGKDLVMSLINPMKNTAQRVGGAGAELARLGLMGVGANDAASFTNPFLKTEEDIAKATDPMQMAKDSAGVLAFGVPGGGATTSVLGKTLAPGLGKSLLTTGAMSGFASSDSENLAGAGVDAGVGAITSLAGGKLLNKVFGGKAATEATTKGGLLTKIKEDLGQGGAAKFGKASPTAYGKASNAGFDLNKTIGKYVGKGTTYEKLLGSAEGRSKGGEFNTILNTAEEKLQKAISDKGMNVVLSTDDVLQPMLSRREKLLKLPGEASKVEAIDEFVNEVTSKYPGGFNAQSALEIKRAMDARFGQSVIKDETATITSDLQKMLANSIRDKLKKAMPEVADALDTQSEVLTLRPIIEHARNISKTQGSTIRRGSLSATNVLNPMTYLDPILGTQKVSSKMAGLMNAGQQEAKDAVAPKMSQEVMRLLSGVVAPNAVNQATAPGEVQANEGDMTQPPMPGQPSESQPPTGNTSGNDPNAWWNQAPEQQGGNSEELQQVLVQLMMLDPSNADMYKSLVPGMSGGVGSRDLPAAQVSALGDIDTSINLMGNLDQTLTQYEDLLGPVRGNIGKRNPYNTDAQAFNAEMTSAAQIVGKAMEGGVLRKEDEEKYKKMLPQITDTPAVAKEKLRIVKDMLDQQRQVKEQTFGQFGFSSGNSGSGEDILQQLLMMQGGI